MPSETLPPLTEVQLFELQTREVTLGIDLQTGSIRSLVFKANQMDLFQQLRGGIPGYAGCLRVYDELEDRWYQDLKDEFAIRNLHTAPGKVSFTKQFVGAPFELTVTYAIEKGFLRWSVEGTKVKASLPDRSLRVHFLTPLIAGWEFWAPCFMGERTFDGMTPFEHCYLQIPYVSTGEVILPMVSHYNKAADVGYSIMEPIDAKVPAAKFVFNNGDRCFTWRAKPKAFQAPVLETVNYYIGLVGDRPMKTEVLLCFHEGDWRPALGRVFDRWNEYFIPKNPRMYELEGMFDGFCIHWDRERPAKRTAQTGGKLFEVHGHFEYYGDYYNEGRDRWLDIIAVETVYQRLGGSKVSAQEVWDWVHRHTPQEIVALIDGKKPAEYTLAEAEERIFTTRKFTQERVAELADNGVHPFWYFNYTDGFRPMVEQRFPDALCKNEDGTIMQSGWFMCHNLNSDPQYSFGQFQIESAKKILHDHPKLAGFFLDCFRHFEVDFGHDDGITVCNNRAAYSVNFSYDPIEAVIEKMLLKHNMCTFANKPQTIRTMRWVDGMMLEGDGDQMEEKYFWSCLAKPVIFLWTSNKASDDENCRRALLHGCFPRVVDNWDPKKPNDATKSEFYRRRQAYMPLYEEFRRRVFCFEADPLRVPKGCRGRLFTVGEDYIAGIANLNLDENAEIKYRKPLYAMFRVKRAHDITKVGVMTPGQKKWKFVKFQFNGTFIAVPLNGFVTGCAVKLFVTKKTGKKIGSAKFQGAVDSCGDPDSSFADTNYR